MVVGRAGRCGRQHTTSAIAPLGAPADATTKAGAEPPKHAWLNNSLARAIVRRDRKKPRKQKYMQVTDAAVFKKRGPEASAASPATPAAAPSARASSTAAATLGNFAVSAVPQEAGSQPGLVPSAAALQRSAATQQHAQHQVQQPAQPGAKMQQPLLVPAVQTTIQLVQQQQQQQRFLVLPRTMRLAVPFCVPGTSIALGPAVVAAVQQQQLQAALAQQNLLQQQSSHTATATPQLGLQAHATVPGHQTAERPAAAAAKRNVATVPSACTAPLDELLPVATAQPQTHRFALHAASTAISPIAAVHPGAPTATDTRAISAAATSVAAINVQGSAGIATLANNSTPAPAVQQQPVTTTPVEALTQSTLVKPEPGAGDDITPMAGADCDRMGATTAVGQAMTTERNGEICPGTETMTELLGMEPTPTNGCSMGCDTAHVAIIASCKPASDDHAAMWLIYQGFKDDGFGFECDIEIGIEAGLFCEPLLKAAAAHDKTAAALIDEAFVCMHDDNDSNCGALNGASEQDIDMNLVDCDQNDTAIKREATAEDMSNNNCPSTVAAEDPTALEPQSTCDSMNDMQHLHMAAAPASPSNDYYLGDVPDVLSPTAHNGNKASAAATAALWAQGLNDGDVDACWSDEMQMDDAEAEMVMNCMNGWD